MKLNKYITTLLIFVLVPFYIFGQEVESKLDEARTAYKNGNLDDARFALQQALDAVNLEISKEILAILPTNMGKMKANLAGDNNSGNTSGYAGIFVKREYKGQKESENSSIELLGDSPLIGSINAILALPPMLTGSDPNQKRIKVNGFKSLMTRSQDSEGLVSYEVQIPFGNSLITFHCSGVSSESDVILLANTIPVSEISKLAQ